MSKRVSATSGVYRIIDVNLNRSREGLRVIEDTVRFVYSDPARTARVRRLRHDIDRLGRDIYSRLVCSRSSRKDPGRLLREKEPRGDVKGILAANFRRVTEAVRVLEEYSKLLSHGTARKMKLIRFRIYTLEKETVSALCGR